MDDFYCSVALPNLAAMTVVREDHLAVAFLHTRPFWRDHIVVVPKMHIESLLDPAGEHRESLAGTWALTILVAGDLMRRTGAAAITTHLGDYQDSKHVHFHVHSGPRLQHDPPAE